MSIEDFQAAVSCFAALNHIDRDTAAKLMSEIGDTPMMNTAVTHVIAGGREWLWPQDDSEDSEAEES